MKDAEQLGQVRPYQGPMSYVMRFVRAGIALAIMGVLGWLGGCSDNPGGPVCCEPSEGLVVSDPSSPTALAGATGALALVSGAGDSVVYVSLPPGTALAGSRAAIRRVGDVASLTTAVLDGGFDPVPVGAQAGDSIEVVVTDAAGGTVLQARLAVAAARPPIVVRTDPPRRKTDVPINASVVIVFSEPIDSGTLTPSSVQLFRGTTAVAGTVSLLGGTATSGVFTPSAPLDGNTDYRLEVTPEVRDLDGDALPATVTVEFTTGTTSVGLANQVAVLPDTAALGIGSQARLIAAARDTFGTPIVGRPVTWSTDNPAVATVSTSGVVTALAEGVAHIQALVDGWPGTATILVSSVLAPVDSVEVAPRSATAVVGGFVQFTAILRDAAGNILPFRPITWQSSNPGVAAVQLESGSGATALVTGVSAGTATITAASEGRNNTATIRTGTVGPYAQISAGGNHTCAVTTNGSAWCWGAGWNGALGNGTQLGVTVPVALAGGLTLSRVSAGEYGTDPRQSCAVATNGTAYCWGSGALGNGSPWETLSTTPVQVSGGLAFTAIDAGSFAACAVAQGGDAYCWGHLWGTVPVAVPGGLTFSTIHVGEGHACALSTSGTAYCWGANEYGQLGDGTTVSRSSPVRVAAGLTFTALSTGSLHTCAITSSGVMYCWGYNWNGQLGIGSASGPEVCPPFNQPTPCSTLPVPVAGSLAWSTVSAGLGHTCAITGAGDAYCWGYGAYGELGNGTPGIFTSPVAVSGGLRFAAVGAGPAHSCGITVAGVAYCWGDNLQGALGIGTTTGPQDCQGRPCSIAPAKVAGQP